MSRGPWAILMADDDEEDRFLAKRALDEALEAKVVFSWVEDGVQLKDYLLERVRSKVNELPDLILLDLNMPRKDGREALLEIKADSALQHIPVVILTTSEEEKDISFTMKAGAESFMTKPATFGAWINMMKSLADRWLASQPASEGA